MNTRQVHQSDPHCGTVINPGSYRRGSSYVFCLDEQGADETVVDVEANFVLDATVCGTFVHSSIFVRRGDIISVQILKFVILC